VFGSEHVRQFGVAGEDQWLFPGQPMRNAKAATWWKKATKAAGVTGVTLHDLRHFYASGLIAAGCDVVTVTTSQPAGVTGVTLHDLRHFYASGLIAAGCDVVTVQKAMGHSSPSTTLNV